MHGFRCYDNIAHSAEREMSAVCLIPLVDKREWQVKLCDPSLTRAIPEHFSDELLTIKYTLHKKALYFISAILREIKSQIPKNTPKGGV